MTLQLSQDIDSRYFLQMRDSVHGVTKSGLHTEWLLADRKSFLCAFDGYLCLLNH